MDVFWCFIRVLGVGWVGIWVGIRLDWYGAVRKTGWDFGGTVVF